MEKTYIQSNFNSQSQLTRLPLQIRRYEQRSLSIYISSQAKFFLAQSSKKAGVALEALEKREGQTERQRALEDAIGSARKAERALKKSEEKAREGVATLSQLEQSLSKARDEVRILSDSDEVLSRRLDTALRWNTMVAS